MAQLYYQQVQAPTTSGAASTIVDAGRGISEGFATIGSGLTKLGERREARQKEEYARKQAMLLEAIGQELAGITDENTLGQFNAALAQARAGAGVAEGAPGATAKAPSQGSGIPASGTAPVGTAALVAGRRAEIIDQAAERADTAKVVEDTRGLRIGNDVSQDSLDASRLATKFQQDEAPTLARMTRLALEGDHEGAMALGAELSERAAPLYGANLVSGAMSQIYTDLGIGDNARTKVLTNENEVNKGLADIDLTKAQTSESYARTEETNQKIARNNWQFSVDVRDDVRQETERLEGQAIKDANARILQSALEPEEALLAADKENLSPTAKLILKDTLAAAMADPNWQDKYQPLPSYFEGGNDRIYQPADEFLSGQRPLSEAPTLKIGNWDTGIPTVPNTNSRMDVPRTVQTIEGNVQQLIQSSDETLSLYGDVVKYEAEIGDGTDNLQQALGEKYGEFFRNKADLNKFYEQLRKVQNGENSSVEGARRLTNAEMMAIADRAIKKRGANFPGDLIKGTTGFPFPGFNITPGNERADQFTVMGKELKSVADNYRKQSLGDLQGRYTAYAGNAEKARALGAKINQLEQSRARAIAKGDDAAKSRYDSLLTDALDELAGINAKVEKTISDSSKKKKK